MNGKACRLFFDLEFDQVLNSGIDGDIVMAKFREVLIAHLKNFLAQLCTGVAPTSPDYGSFTMIELDSSNLKKFSRHLIITLNSLAFRDITHVGFFVWDFCSKIMQRIGGGDETLNCLLIKKEKEKEKKLFVDTGVYTKKRCLRLVLSAKFKDLGRRHLRVYNVDARSCINDKLLTKKTFFSSLASYPEKQETQMIIDFSKSQPDK